jgi:hypothetical protein
LKLFVRSMQKLQIIFINIAYHKVQQWFSPYSTMFHIYQPFKPISSSLLDFCKSLHVLSSPSTIGLPKLFTNYNIVFLIITSLFQNHQPAKGTCHILSPCIYNKVLFIL